jgi:hypothetical protein
MKKYLHLLVTISLGIVIALFLGEILLRAYDYFRPIHYFTDDKIFKYRGKPLEKVFGYPLNSKGFKDVEYPLVKPKDSYRIVAVGDSFAFGLVPYPENFLTLLEEHLNTGTQQRYEIINMGIPGTEPPEYLRLVQSEGLDYNPDMVLLSLFIGNDLYLKLERNMTPKKPVSYLYTFLKNTFKVFDSIDVIGVFTAQEPGDAASASKCEQYRNRVAMNMEKYIQFENDAAKITTDIELFNEIQKNMSALYKLNMLLDQRGVDLVIVLIPEEPQINRAIRGFITQNVELMQKSSSRKLAVDFTLPNKTFKSLFMGDITTIDLYDELLSRQDRSPTSFYIECDGHWNKEGNAAAAEIIHQRLKPLLPAP